jgi:HAD superfamily hydrolase (TIGR01509 family)
MIAVGFDFDHTLGLDNKIEATIALEMLAEIAGPSYDAQAAAHGIGAALASYRQGDLTVEEGIGSFFERYSHDAAASRHAAAEFRPRVVARSPEFTTALPGARETLSALRALGIPYALLTNGWSPLQEAKAAQIGFDGAVFVSERLGARKPSQRAFEALADHFACPFPEIWYVGDDPRNDVAGANACGAISVWFDWEGLVYPQDLSRPTYRIGALDELIPLVQGQIKEAAKGRG